MTEHETSSPPTARQTWLQRLVVWMVLSLVRSIYKVKAVHAERVPKNGGVLLLPNHASYVDALIIGAACPRHVRFVMWDALYRIWWMNGFLRLVGTVPISATRAKDAVRSVAGALEEGGVVCIFPEGRMTRHGMMNDLRKGYELMARQGDAVIQPVHLDGLWGSIFSAQGGRYFKKRPKHLRYPVVVRFGMPLEVRGTTPTQVRDAILDLGREAMLARDAWQHAGADRAAFGNGLRMRDAEWYRPGDVFWCLEPADSLVARTVHETARLLPGSKIVTRREDAHGAPIVAFCSSATAHSLEGTERLAFCWDTDPATTVCAPAKVLRGLFDASTGTLLCTEVPDPPTDADDHEPQFGRKQGALGRLLPGLAVSDVPAGLRVDDEGYVWPEKA